MAARASRTRNEVIVGRGPLGACSAPDAGRPWPRALDRHRKPVAIAVASRLRGPLCQAVGRAMVASMSTPGLKLTRARLLSRARLQVVLSGLSEVHFGEPGRSWGVTPTRAGTSTTTAAAIGSRSRGIDRGSSGLRLRTRANAAGARRMATRARGSPGCPRLCTTSRRAPPPRSKGRPQACGSRATGRRTCRIPSPSTRRGPTGPSCSLGSAWMPTTRCSERRGRTGLRART